MKYLLGKLNTETFIFDLKDPLEKKLSLPDFILNVPDAMTIEVEIRRDQNLNELFDVFSREGIYINSMRNKHNRLEELFIRLLDKNKS